MSRTSGEKHVAHVPVGKHLRDEWRNEFRLPKLTSSRSGSDSSCCLLLPSVTRAHAPVPLPTVEQL